jgi:hypothetical protein
LVEMTIYRSERSRAYPDVCGWIAAHKRIDNQLQTTESNAPHNEHVEPVSSSNSVAEQAEFVLLTLVNKGSLLF